MSYTVALFDFALPEDFDAAMQIFESMVDRTVEEIKPKYLAFYQEVIRMYPSITTLPEDKYEESIWSDGPLINNFYQTAPVLGFTFSQLEAVPVVFELANTMGLSVLDWQTGSVYNPS